MVSNISRWVLRQPVRWFIRPVRSVWRPPFSPPLRFLATTTAAEPEGASPNKTVLRDYQEECIASVMTAIDEGHKRLGISLATGGGKTIIFTHLIGRIKAASQDSGQTLILAHRQELVEQAARHCHSTYPDKHIEIEMGNMHATGYADITIASIASITSGERLKKFDPSRFKLVLVDEAHHIVAKTYLKTLEHFNLHVKHPSSPTLVGVSATFARADGLSLGKAIDQIVYHRDFVDMIKNKRLASLMFTTVQSAADLSEVRTHGKFGEFVTSELSRAVNTLAVNAITIATWQVKALATRKSTLVFCVDVQHILDLCEGFRARGIDARYVTGQTKTTERFNILTAFKNQEFPVLINCGVFTEGTDIPNIDCILLARPTRSRSLLIQMIGRGMRLHSGKKNCHVLDMVSSLETGIVTTPTLFGLDPADVFTETTVKDIDGMQEEAVKEAEGSKTQKQQAHFSGTSGIELTDYNSVVDLLEDASSERHIRALSRNSWVGIGQDRYYLGAPSGSFLRLEKVTATLAEMTQHFKQSSQTHTISNTAAYDVDMLSDSSNDYDDDLDYDRPGGGLFNNTGAYSTAQLQDHDFGSPSETPASVHYLLYFIAALPRSRRNLAPFATARLMLIHTDFSAAVRAADTYAKKKFPYEWILATAKWRKSTPTEGQLNALNKMRSEENQLTADSITKGKASDMITKMKFGSIKKRYAKIAMERKKVIKELNRSKEHHEKMRKDGEVKVGPVRSPVSSG